MKQLYLLIILTTVSYNFSLAQNPEKDFRKLSKCIIYDNEIRAERLLTKGIDINARDDKGRTPLLFALYKNKPNFAYFLLQHGADITLTDDIGNTSLHYAIENVSDRRVIDTLIARGAKLEVTNSQGYSPFHFSILFACPDLPFQFIKKGVYIHGITALGENALFLSLEAGCDTLTRYLLANNIDTRLIDTRGNSALIKAVQFNRTEFALQLAEEEKNLDLKNQEGHPALYYSLNFQNDTVFNKLIAEGATLNNDAEGALYLEIASQNENTPIVTALLEKGIENPMNCQSAEACFNSAYICSIESRITSDSVQISKLDKSILLYTTSKEKFKKDLNEIRSDNTVRILGECCLAVSYAFMGMVYVGSGDDYQAEERAYLKEYIKLCEQRIADLQKTKTCLTSGGEETDKENCFL